MYKSTSYLLLSLWLLCLLASCNNFNTGTKTASDTLSYFEGEIKLSETQGLWGELYEVHTTFLLSENRLKREQVLGGINRVFNVYAGMLVDLAKDTVVLYFSDKMNNTHVKQTFSIQAYKNYLQYHSTLNRVPMPYDKTFVVLDKPSLIRQVKDSMKLEGFTTDYTLYNDSSGFVKLDAFDTKELKIRRALLEMVFINIPKSINFPLQSEIRTTMSDVELDSLTNQKQPSAIEDLTGILTGQKDSTANRNDVKRLAKNKWFRKSFSLLKKGVDLNLHITILLSEVIRKTMPDAAFSLPDGNFTEIADFDAFLDKSWNENSGDIDD